MSDAEIRGDGWQGDVGQLRRQVATLARANAMLRAERDAARPPRRDRYAEHCNLHREPWRSCGACYDVTRAERDGLRAERSIVRTRVDEFLLVAEHLGEAAARLGAAGTEIRLASRRIAYTAVQLRDGLPCQDTGISHCVACHGADGDPQGPRCGHTAGCPEC